jgi:response regulator RpfG family c-di-GMP phosphodiesterase
MLRRRPRNGGGTELPDMMKILVIDDNPGVRRTLSKLLTKSGYDVLTAADGDRDIRIFREHPYARAGRNRKYYQDKS